MKLFLFATDHDVQRGSAPPGLADEPARFRTEILSIVRSYSISVLAEEMNPEGVSSFLEPRNDSVLKEVAEELHISHLYCEPSRAERNATGLSGAALWAWREQKWLDQLQACNKSSVLFVFGADHLKSFRTLANRSEDLEVFVVHCDWGGLRVPLI